MENIGPLSSHKMCIIYFKENYFRILEISPSKLHVHFLYVATCSMLDHHHTDTDGITV